MLKVPDDRTGDWVARVAQRFWAGAYSDPGSSGTVRGYRNHRCRRQSRGPLLQVAGRPIQGGLGRDSSWPAEATCAAA
jgi:hypothetical protein